jgi:actin-related protein
VVNKQEKSFSSSLLLPLTEIISDNLDFITELAFEKLNFPVIGFEHPATCSLIASGQVTGLVVDLGYTSTR